MSEDLRRGDPPHNVAHAEARREGRRDEDSRPRSGASIAANTPHNDNDSNDGGLSEGEMVAHSEEHGQGSYRHQRPHHYRNRNDSRHDGNAYGHDFYDDVDAPRTWGREQSDDGRRGRRPAQSWSRSASRSRSRTRSRSTRRYRRGYTHSRSRSPRRHPGPGYASDTVIIEGLPVGVTAVELRDALLQARYIKDGSEIDVRVPNSKTGARRAFVQFPTINLAAEFMRVNYPKIFLALGQGLDLHERDADGRMVLYIHYARRTEDPAMSAASWTCPTCDFLNYPTRHRCKECSTPQPPPPNLRPHLTGESDAAPASTTAPTQILVVYPLPPDLGEARLADDVRRLEMEPRQETTKETPGKLKSTAPSGNTARLGGRPGSLHRVFIMRDRDTDDALRFGFAEFWTAADATAALTKYSKAPTVFTVAGASVVVAATHAGVFVPESESLEGQDDRFSFSPLFNTGLRVRYWEPTVYASARIVAAEAPAEEGSRPDNAQSDEKRSKKRKADATGGPPVAAKKVAMPMSSTVAMWQKKSAELRTDDNNKPAIRISLSADAALAMEGGTKEEVESFVDRDKLCCLLCKMKYKSMVDVDKHERSRNHKTALEDGDRVKAARQRLAKGRESKGVIKEGDEDEGDDGKYRDRAKERREAFSQPSRPAPSQTTTNAPVPTTSTTTPPADAPKMSKGSAMLAKMGWTAGRGLGADGAGRTEIVETRVYQEGVGLGAEGGDLGDAAVLGASRTRNSYAEYVSSVQDRARARYERIGKEE